MDNSHADVTNVNSEIAPSVKETSVNSHEVSDLSLPPSTVQQPTVDPILRDETHTLHHENSPESSTVYPSQDQDNYRGPKPRAPRPREQQHKTVKMGKTSVIVKAALPKKHSTPKFVPRQVSRGTPVSKLEKQKETVDRAKPDPVNERLRQQALELGASLGPHLPAEEHQQREQFKQAATTGSEQLDKTAAEIRKQVMKVQEK